MHACLMIHNQSHWTPSTETNYGGTGVKGATALSQAVIGGGALAGVAVTLHKRHPYDPTRPLIDFDLALMLLPVILLGVSVGARALHAETNSHLQIASPAKLCPTQTDALSCSYGISMWGLACI